MEKWKKTGFIGAGKAGFSLGRYMVEHHVDVSGYYSQNPESARKAAEFTGSNFYDKIETVVRESEVIFLTVPDKEIAKVWEQLKVQHIEGKIVCHVSGALSSDVFSDIDRCKAYGYSIHPLFAIHDKLKSYKELSQCLITIEGSERYQSYFKTLFAYLGNEIQVLKKEDKIRYHAAAAMASNLMVALASVCEKQLELCGFTQESAASALAPILKSNMEHIVTEGCQNALTGPIERCDIQTVQKHLDTLSGNAKVIYQTLSKELIPIAKQKNPERNYEKMEELLEL